MAPRISPPRPPSVGGSRRVWALVGVIVFLLADVALVGIALAATRPVDHGTPAPAPSFSSDPSVSTPAATSPAATSPATASPANAPPATAVPGAEAAPRFLSAVSASEAWRATPGSCPGPDAVIERTTDAGVTWQALSTGKNAVHRVAALAGASVVTSVVGASGNDCAVGFFSTFTNGQFWAPYPGNLGGASYIDPRDHAIVHTPVGPVSAPCDTALQVVTARDAATAVLCAGSVFERTDHGSWASAQTPGVLALTTSDTGYTLAVAGVPGCPGVAIEALRSPLDADARPTMIGCATAVATPQAVTLSQSGRTLWLWSGDTVWISSDGGATWRS